MKLIELFEGTNTSFKVTTETLYKKGLKKHRHNKKAMKVLNSVLDTLKSGRFPSSAPPLKNHKTGGVHKGKYDVHIDGNQIVLLYSVDKDNKIIILHGLGSHRELNL